MHLTAKVSEEMNRKYHILGLQDRTRRHNFQPLHWPSAPQWNAQRFRSSNWQCSMSACSSTIGWKL